MTSGDQGGATTHDPGVLWRTPPTGRRGPKPRHTLNSIAEAAIAVADEEGLDAVTMQRVAERLGTTKMALYRYFPARADLDAAMLDHALGPPPALPEVRWDEALAAWATALFERATERPWSVELAQRPHAPGPHELGWYENGLTATTGLALTGGERLDLLALLSGHALSLVRQQSGGSHAAEEELAGQLVPVLIAHADRYPSTLAAFMDAARTQDRDDALLFGVHRILAGIAALIAERGA